MSALKPYPAYKDSGIEWLGEVPEGWEVRPAVTLAGVLTPTTDKKTYDGEDPVQLCNYTDVYYGDQIVASPSYMVATASNEQRRRYSVTAGDVPFTKDSETSDDIGISAFVPEDLPGVVYGYHLGVYRPNDKRYSRFLKYVLDSAYAKTDFEVKTPGVTRVGLSQATVRYFRVPTPVPEDAQAIADFLDRETAEIDAFVSTSEQLIELLNERRAAVIQTVFSNSGSPRVPLWSLSNIPIENGVDATGDSSNPDTWPRYVRTTDISGQSTLDPEKRVTIDPSLVGRSTLQPGDLIMTRAGATVGKSYLHDSDEVVCYAGYLVRLRPKIHRALPKYLAYWMESTDYWDQVELGTIKSTIENFSASKYKTLRVPAPPLPEQKAIVARLDRETAQIDEAISEARKAIELAKERRQTLISAAVTGKIDVREAV